jgi:para-nitrobenzyl esterase
VVACLRALPVSALLAQGGLKWRPTVDAQVITQVPARAFQTGNFNQVPVMIGGVYDEGTLFVDTKLSAGYYPLYLRGLAPAGYDTTAIEAAYPIGNYAVPAQGVARAMGDAMYACGNSARRDALSAWVPVYGWEMTDPQLSCPAKPAAFYYGTAHGMDSYYLTGTVDALPSYPYFDPGAPRPTRPPPRSARRCRRRWWRTCSTSRRTAIRTATRTATRATSRRAGRASWGRRTAR